MLLINGGKLYKISLTYKKENGEIISEESEDKVAQRMENAVRNARRISQGCL